MKRDISNHVTSTCGYLLKVLQLSVVGILSLTLQAKGQEKEWDQSYNNGITSLQQTTNDGGYILGGNYGGDYGVTKTNAAGEVEWFWTYGGNSNEGLFTVQQTSDGGYILGGESWSNASGSKSEDSRGAADFWVVKLNANGDVEWDKTFGGSSYDYLFALVQTNDGGYIMGGWSYSPISGDKTEANFGNSCYNLSGIDICTTDYWVVKINAAGEKEWDKTFGGSGYDYLQAIQQTEPDGGYILAGYSLSNVSGDKTQANEGTCNDRFCTPDGWVVKLNANGDVEWDKTFGGADDDMIYSVEKTSDGGYILGGNTLAPGGGGAVVVEGIGTNNYWVVKLDATGQKVWERTLGGSSWDYLTVAKQTMPDGGYILGGWSSSPISGDKTESSRGGVQCDDEFKCRDYWVVKLDPTGNKEWDKTLGGSEDDLLYDLEQTNDGGYILGGFSNSGSSGDKTSSQQYVGWLVKLHGTGTCTPPSLKIAVKPTSNVYTGGNANTIYLGYGPQSVQLVASGAEGYEWSPATGLSSTTVADPVFTPTAAGTYTFTVTGYNGSCAATDTVTITVVDIRCGKDKVLICHRGKQICISVSAVENHLRNHREDRLGGCDTGKHTNENTGKALSLTVFPNPLRDRASVELILAEDGPYLLELYNANGKKAKVVAEGRSKSGELVSLELKDEKLRGGVYYLHLTTKDEVRTLRLILHK